MRAPLSHAPLVHNFNPISSPTLFFKLRQPHPSFLELLDGEGKMRRSLALALVSRCSEYNVRKDLDFFFFYVLQGILAAFGATANAQSKSHHAASLCSLLVQLYQILNLPLSPSLSLSLSLYSLSPILVLAPPPPLLSPINSSDPVLHCDTAE